MPILLSINKNYFHYSNISNHLLYSILFYSLYTILPPLKNMFYNTKYNFQTYSLAYFKKK